MGTRRERIRKTYFRGELKRKCKTKSRKVDRDGLDMLKEWMSIKYHKKKLLEVNKSGR
jgi:hypothetical protein